MTLLMQVSVGPTNTDPFPFVIATSDTRSIYRRLYLDTLEYDDKILKSRDDSFDKIVRVSNNALLSTGGTYEVSRPMKDFILEKTKEHYYLDDFEPILEEGYKFLKENGDEVIKKFLGTRSVYVCLVGFFKNGCSGRLSLGADGKADKTEVPPLCVAYNIFAPSEDIGARQDELMNFANSPFLNLLNEGKSAVDVYIKHLLLVHSIVASQEVDTISETCLLHFLQKRNGEMYHEYHEIDLSEQIKSIQDSF